MDYRNGVRQVSVFNMGGEKVIYLSGAITGKDREDYMSEFSYYEEKLKAERSTFDTETKEFEPLRVINPAKTLDTLPKLTDEQYMRLAFQLVSLCDTIYFLPNWEQSKGAKKEMRLALAMGLDIELAPTE